MMPHFPQLLLSLNGTTQAPLQAIWPAGQVVTHVPPWQTWLTQAVIHVPQWLLSVCRWTQAFGHWSKPALQAKPQAPAAHVGVALTTVVVQTLSQPPQLRVSVSVLTQTPLQGLCPPGQTMTVVQTPFWQISPVPQACAQLPQFLTSVAKSTHIPPQLLVPDGQLTTHTPPWQVCPLGQIVPQ